MACLKRQTMGTLETPQILLIRHFCASRYQAQAQAFWIFERKLSGIGRTSRPQRRSTLVEFLEHVDAIMGVAKAQTTKRLLAIFIKMLLGMYSIPDGT
jgi:hypothetical protein